MVNVLAVIFGVEPFYFLPLLFFSFDFVALVVCAVHFAFVLLF